MARTLQSGIWAQVRGTAAALALVLSPLLACAECVHLAGHRHGNTVLPWQTQQAPAIAIADDASTLQRSSEFAPAPRSPNDGPCIRCGGDGPDSSLPVVSPQLIDDGLQLTNRHGDDPASESLPTNPHLLYSRLDDRRIDHPPRLWRA